MISVIMNSYRIPTMYGVLTYICWIFMVNIICHTWMVWDTESPPFWPKVWHSSFKASFAVTGVSKSGLVAPTPLQQFPNDKDWNWLDYISSIWINYPTTSKRTTNPFLNSCKSAETTSLFNQNGRTELPTIPLLTSRQSCPLSGKILSIGWNTCLIFLLVILIIVIHF